MGRYTISERISFGGFGAVYKAVQDTLGREVAVKILLPEIFLSNRDYVEQFRQEALLTSQLRHPNTITVYDYGETESGLLFLVMEWLDGATLSQALRASGAFSYERAFHISHQILKSLTEAHEKGMVHRDLKPSNLFLCEQYGEKDVVKVLDFGLVKALEPESLTPAGMVAPNVPSFTQKRRAPGTPHYMAPEQATGKGTTPASDIYSFGLILHEMLTGKRAVDGPDKMSVLLKQAREVVPPLPAIMQTTFLGKVVARCVEKNPKKRPQSGGELLAEFRRVEDTAGVEVESSDLVTTERWRQMMQPQSLSAEISSGPEEEFLGRESELEEFQGLLDKGERTGGGVVVTISGEVGIGKSALASQFADRFSEQLGGRVTKGAFLPFDREPMTGFKRVIRELLGVRANEMSAGRHEVRRGLEALGLSDFYLLNFLTNFVFSNENAESGRHERNARLEGFFGSIAERAPLMLLLENLNWSDAESLDFLWHMAASDTVRTRPLHVLATFRTKSTLANRELQLVLERLGRLDHQAYRELRLGSLERRACTQIMERAIEMQRAMVKSCLKLTHGNPLYLENVIRYLVDESAHLDVQRGGRTDEPLSSAKLYLPTSMEKVFERRVDQVVRKYGQDTFRDILARAALVGETFRPDVLELALRKEGRYELVDRLTRALELWRREGVVRRPSESDPELEFVHPHLVESFFQVADGRLHLITAQAKEEAYDEGISRELEAVELARHNMAAGQLDRAIGFMRSAAADARNNNNFVRARELHQELIEMLDIARGDHRSLCKQSYLELGELCLNLSEFGPAADYYDRALELANTDNDAHTEGLCYYGKASLALARNEFDEADTYFLKARKLVSEETPQDYARLLLGMGRVSRTKGDWDDAQARFERAYELGGQERNYAIMAQALHALGSLAFELGNVRAAHEWYEQSLSFYTHTLEHSAMADALLDRARTSLFYRRLEEALDATERALAIKQRHGDQVGAARGLLGLGRYHTCRLELDVGQKFVLRALPVFKNLGERAGIAECQEVLAQIRMLRAEFDMAQSLFEQALELFRQIGGMRNQVFQLLHLAAVQLQLGEIDAARPFINEATTLLDGHSSDAYRAMLLRVRGLFHELTGDAAAAEADYARAGEVAARSDQLVEQYFNRILIIKMNILRDGGRWYQEELWGFATTAQQYDMPDVRAQALLTLAWLEGVYGERDSWESAIKAIKQLATESSLSTEALLAPFKIEVQAATRHLDSERHASFLQSADWIEQSLLNR